MSFELLLGLVTERGIVETTLQGGTSTSPGGEEFDIAAVHTDGLRGLSLSESRLGVWVCTPDRDPRVPAAPTLDPASVRRILADARLLKSGPRDGLSADSVAPTLAAYRAGRRCVVRVARTGAGREVVYFFKTYRRLPKALRGGLMSELGGHLQRISDGAIRFPRLLFVDTDRRLAITESVETADGHAGYSRACIRRAARAAAALHTLRADRSCGLLTHDASEELSTVARWRHVAPGLVSGARLAQFEQLLAALGVHAARVPSDGRTLVHRDYYHSQLQRDGQTLWILDWDTLCFGDPEVDLAAYLAHQILQALQDANVGGEPPRAESGFLDEYVDRGGSVRPDRLRFYLACALTRLGILHFTRGVPGHIVDTMWHTADAVLHGSRDLASELAGCLRGSMPGGASGPR